MSTQWVDFKELREKLDFRQLLTDYGIELKVKGEQAHGFCPLPTHEGKRNSPSFSVNLKRRIFQCFGCGAKGNALEFATRMEGLDPDQPTELRQAALKLQERYFEQATDCKAPKPPVDRLIPNRPTVDRAGKADPAAKPAVDDSRERIVNAPLDFELKRLDPDHPYLKDRGLTAETIAHFGLGYCKQGLMKGRIAIPMHDAEGRLIGYAGRLVDDEAIGEENPKYLFPGTREKEEKVYTFSKSLFLFNAHRIQWPVEDLIVVEGFFGVFHLHQLGRHNVVAVMGSSCSSEQGTLVAGLTDFDARVWLMPDGDEGGRRCALSTFGEVASERFVRWIQLEIGEQPEDCDSDRLSDLLDLPVK